MQRFVINRNTPKMEPFILIGYETYEDFRHVSYVEDEDNERQDEIKIKVPSEKSIQWLSEGETIYFRKRSGVGSDVSKWEVYAEAPVTVLSVVGNVLTVTAPCYEDLTYILSSDDEEPGVMHLDKNYEFLPEDFAEYKSKFGVNMTATTEIYGTTAETPVWELYPVYRKHNSSFDDDLFVINYDRSLINTSAFGTKDSNLGEYDFPMIFRTDINRFFYKVGENDYRLFDSVEIVKKMEYFEVKTKLETSDEINLLQQNTVSDFFSEEIKSKIIPDFVDMEKVMYEPVMDGSGVILCNEIEFNFHFRVREDDDAWSIKDSDWWNGINNGTTLSINKVQESDTMDCLNFTNDDVRYQKMKVKKSFIRLSFYDSDNPLTQQLLYYSTIFLDSGVLFGDFVKGRSRDLNFGVENLSTRITVRNKYNNDKSSEGFYLYLFKNETDKDGASKNVYMKVEFNHAGYGRTLPMIKPKYGPDDKPEEVPFKEYSSYQYVKLSVKTLPVGETNYIYYVDEDNKYAVQFDQDNRKIIFNLFEVKIA